MDATPRMSGPAPLGAAPSRLASAAASLWWVGYHLPKLFLNYYGLLWAKQLRFGAFQRRGREARLRSDDARELVRAYRESHLAASDTYLRACSDRFGACHGRSSMWVKGARGAQMTEETFRGQQSRRSLP